MLKPLAAAENVACARRLAAADGLEHKAPPAGSGPERDVTKLKACRAPRGERPGCRERPGMAAKLAEGRLPAGVPYAPLVDALWALQAPEHEAD